ncbi:hypothetical protein D3C71_810080 [compost metagenome]
MNKIRLRPIASDNGPAISCPIVIPEKIPMMTHCDWLLFFNSKIRPISPKAGKTASIEKETIDMSNAMSNANSRKWIFDFIFLLHYF